MPVWERTVDRNVHNRPKCGHQATESMPTDACQLFYDCKGCGQRLRPKSGDCCVFCSYGSGPCPLVQAGNCCN
ncbi:MAG: GDCCVxC domain-containing (seleno)protein [Pseudolabrys sp.]